VIKNGGLALHGKMSGPDDVKVTVTDKGDGTYEVAYRPTVAGEYKLEVTLGGRPLGGKKPLPLLVIPSGPSGANSVAFGPGLEKARLEGDNVFTVEARDQFDNPVTLGGSTVGGKLTHIDTGEAFSITCDDNNNGTYTCSYPSVSRAGKYHVVPTLNGASVKGAPFHLVVNPGGFLLDNTVVSFEQTSLAGTPAGLVQLLDSRRNPLVTGGDSVEADVLPLTKLEVKVRDNRDGTYNLVYPPDFRGAYDISLQINGEAVPGGPWTVKIDENPLEDDIKEALAHFVPKTQHLWANILSNATPQERQLVIRELKALTSGKPLSDADIAHLSAEQPSAILLL